MEPAKATDLDPAAYNSFIEGLDLVSVEVVKVHAERTAAGIADQTRFDLAASYIQDDAILHYRYELAAHFKDDQANPLGNTAATVQLTVRASTHAEGACIEQFGGTSGVLMAHPYLRETIASMAQRIGFPGVLLPMIKHQSDQEAERNHVPGQGG